MKTQSELKALREEREKWFLDRIGKKIYRGPNGCDCDTCKRGRTEGVTVYDRDHAIYLCDVEAEIGPRYLDFLPPS